MYARPLYWFAVYSVDISLSPSIDQIDRSSFVRTVSCTHRGSKNVRRVTFYDSEVHSLFTRLWVSTGTDGVLVAETILGGHRIQHRVQTKTLELGI